MGSFAVEQRKIFRSRSPEPPRILFHLHTRQGPKPSDGSTRADLVQILTFAMRNWPRRQPWLAHRHPGLPRCGHGTSPLFHFTPVKTGAVDSFLISSQCQAQGLLLARKACLFVLYGPIPDLIAEKSTVSSESKSTTITIQTNHGVILKVDVPNNPTQQDHSPGVRQSHSSSSVAYSADQKPVLSPQVVAAPAAG